MAGKQSKRTRGFGTAFSEQGRTYEQTSRETKEAISESEVREHWEARAKRKGLQAVMSARHWRITNWIESRKLKRNIFNFLKGRVEGKRVFELGFGIGRMTTELAKRAREVIAADASEEMHRKASQNLKGARNVTLHKGKITEVATRGEFDLVFDSIVLLHILNPAELRATAERMKQLCADNGHVFLCEHVYEPRKSEGSRYSIFRRPEEYEKLFEPFELVARKPTRVSGDLFMMYLFKKK